MTPKAVVLAEHEADIDAVVRFAVAKASPRRAPLTNLTGSAVGSGIILDVSKMNRILNERGGALDSGTAGHCPGGAEQATRAAQSCCWSGPVQGDINANSAVWSPTIPPARTR